MDIRQPNTTTEAQAIISMVHYCSGMCTRISRILAFMTEAANVPKGGNMLCNYDIEDSFE